MDWAKLKTFHAAASTGSLTAAATREGVSQSAVSRHIAQLESELGVSLFHRHARGLRLTEPGSLLFAATADMAHHAQVAETRVRDSRDQPSGDMYVTAPVELGTLALLPHLERFLSAYPDLRLYVDLSDEETDLSSGQVQAALRLWRSKQSDLDQKLLLSVQQGVYASPEYISRHGAPQNLAELCGHPLIVYSGAARTPMNAMSWLLSAARAVEPKLQPRLSVNTGLGVMTAIQAGAGVGSLPDYLARETGDLVRILPDLSGPPFEMYFVYPQEFRGSRRIAAFGAFIDDWIGALAAAA